MLTSDLVLIYNDFVIILSLFAYYYYIPWDYAQIEGGECPKKRKMIGGGVAIRFGSSKDGNYGSTVQHIHAHLIEPDLKALGPTEAWRFKFGQPKNYRKSH